MNNNGKQQNLIKQQYCELRNLPRNGTKVSCLNKKIRCQWNLFSLKLKSLEMTLLSLSVSCFRPRHFVPHRKWNFPFLAHPNKGKENNYQIFFLAILIITLGRFYRANEKNKNCHIHLHVYNTKPKSTLQSYSWP